MSNENNNTVAVTADKLHTRMMEVHGIFVTLREALSNMDEKNGPSYADVAQAGAKIVDEVLQRLETMEEQSPNGPDTIPNLRKDIEKQRQRLMGACSVLNMCRYACASMYKGLDTEEYFDALGVVVRAVGNVAGEMEVIANHWPDIDDDDIDDD